MSIVVSGSVHSITSTSPAAIFDSSLRVLQRRQRAFQPAQVDRWIPPIGFNRFAVIAPTLDTPAGSRQVPRMVADSEIQRIARLTPLADVLASFDLSVGPVEPREEAVSNALGLTLAASAVIAEGHPKAALALRDGYAVRSDATLDASVLRAGAAVARAGARRYRRCAARRRRRGGARSMPCRCGRGKLGARRRSRPAKACWRRTPTPPPGCSCGWPARGCGGSTWRCSTALGVERVLVRQPRVRVVRAGDRARSSTAPRR